MGLKKSCLPKTADLFFLTRCGNKRLERAVYNFHAWMRKKRIPLKGLTWEHIECYLIQPKQRVIKENSRRCLYNIIKPYLIWLHDHEYIGFMPQNWKRPPTPQTVMEFIDTLMPVIKKTTCRGYSSCLRSFHFWLTANKLELSDIRRKHVEQWLQHLAQRDISSVHRNKQVICTRMYFRWLYERGLITAYPEELLRARDIPKIPAYLPRPFPPEVDRELQKRLAAGNRIHHKALLLMRRTGLRMGELVQLTPLCLEKDHMDNAFLKVPLGKLDNERMVPLDKDTRKLLEELQCHCQKDSEFLLEPNTRRPRLRQDLSRLLRDITSGLDTNGPATSHRLRHTYATELLNAGMSLVGIMRLLGHHSIQMTLRYAALTQDAVAKEYHDAFSKIQFRYRLPSQSISEPNPERALLDTISWLKKYHYSNPSSKRTSNRIIKRIHSIRYDISKIIAQSNAS